MISFIIPAYNESALIERCIRSIRREADNLSCEILVVDNGSTDDTVKVAMLAGARVIFEPRKGVTRARQTGFEKSMNDLIAFIDADSVLPPGWLNRALQAIEGDAVAASGPVVYFELPLRKRLVGFVFYCLAKIAISSGQCFKAVISYCAGKHCIAPVDLTLT